MSKNQKIQTLGRLELTDRVSSRVGHSEKDVRKVLDDMLNEIAKSVAQGEDVKLPNFGKFNFMKKKERLARNPRTKVPAVVEQRNVISFRFAKSFQEKVTCFHSRKQNTK